MSDLLASLALLHGRSDDTVEIEEFHKEPDACADWNDRFPTDGCPGHYRAIHICDQCGVTFDDGEPAFSEWPCETAKLLGLDVGQSATDQDRGMS